MVNTNLTYEYIIMISPFIFILVLFGITSFMQANVDRQKKQVKKKIEKKEPFKSRRQKLKEYNRKERQNK